MAKLIKQLPVLMLTEHDEKGIQAVIALQKAGGIREGRDTAISVWASMGAMQQAMTMSAYQSLLMEKSRKKKKKKRS